MEWNENQRNKMNWRSCFWAFIRAKHHTNKNRLWNIMESNKANKTKKRSKLMYSTSYKVQQYNIRTSVEYASNEIVCCLTVWDFGYFSNRITWKHTVYSAHTYIYTHSFDRLSAHYYYLTTMCRLPNSLSFNMYLSVPSPGTSGKHSLIKKAKVNKFSEHWNAHQVSVDNVTLRLLSYDVCSDIMQASESIF